MSGRNAFFSTVLFVVAVLVSAVSVVVIASGDAVRWKMDATKSRSYSLSPQTQSLLAGLEANWTVAVVVVESQADPATVRQIDEVLDRLAAAAPTMAVQRIDPTDPASIADYEALLIDLQHRYAPEIATCEDAIQEGLSAFRGLMSFAASQAGALRAVADQSPEASRNELIPRVGALSLLAGQGALIIDEVERKLQVDQGRPLPDFGSAIAILIQALSQWSEELEDATRLMGTIRSSQAPPLRAVFAAEAARLAIAADRLKRLPDLALSKIARQLQGGEAAIVMGPAGAAVIPAGQLLPGAVAGDGDRVSFDRRFRGEQLFASAIRSLRDQRDPTVIFVHGEDRSMLEPSPQNVDVSGAVAMLEAARVKVLEWSVNAGGPPVVDPTQPAVWIILPPAQRTGLKPSEAEMKLLRTTADLIAEGQSVLISLYPSLLPRYGQADPWAALVEGLGVEARTGTVIAESRRNPDGRDDIQLVQPLTEFTESHPIAAALHGQTLALPLPIPVAWADATEDGPGRLLARVEPSESRWFAADWSPQNADQLQPEGDALLEVATPLVAAVERSAPVGNGSQRILVVGSGGWMLNYVADMVLAAGGDRYALLYPGNHELLLSGTSWLAGLDDRIAPGPLSQEVARLGSLSPSIRRLWTWILLLGLPGVVATGGMVMWWMRRR